MQGLVSDGCTEHRLNEVRQALRGQEVTLGDLGQVGEASF